MKLRIVRLAAVGTAVFLLAQQVAGAAQVSSGMGVGVTIVPNSANGKNSKARPIFVSAIVTKTEPANTYTWNAAAISVKHAGFKQPRRMQRLSTVYWFEAQRQRTRFRIAVSAVTGKIVKVVRT